MIRMAGKFSKMGITELVFEENPLYSLWIKIILAGTPAILFISAIFLYYENTEDALLMMGVAVLISLMFKFILPSRFQVYQDRLVIKLGGPLKINLGFSSIKEVRRASASKVFAYGGIRFATSTKSVVEIVRNKGLNMVISPKEPDRFVEQLNRAITADST